jgi:hypothetical protein
MQTQSTLSHRVAPHIRRMKATAAEICSKIALPTSVATAQRFDRVSWFRDPATPASR